MEHVSSAISLVAASAVSTHVDAVMAAEQVCEEIVAHPGLGSIDLAMAFVSGGHTTDLPHVAEVIRKSLSPGTFVGVTSEGVIAGASELERRPAVVLFCASLPGTSLHPFTYRRLPHAAEGDPEALARVAEAVGARSDARGVFFFADPFSIPAASAVETIASCHSVVPGLPRLPVIGGMASGGNAPGKNILVLDNEVMRAGAIGVTVRGSVALDTLVSQGCRPIGRPLVVTAGTRNVIRSLGGMTAVEALREVVHSLSEQDKALLPRGVFVGRVINEYKDRFGRGDFLIRDVVGADENSGAIAIADLVHIGQTVQFHLRDAATATEDLELLLVAQSLLGTPIGGLLFTCNGRGKRLFNVENHDASTISKAFSGGTEGAFPLAGFFAAGEIGPIGDRSFVHGHTASLALFRQLRPQL